MLSPFSLLSRIPKFELKEMDHFHRVGCSRLEPGMIIAPIWVTASR